MKRSLFAFLLSGALTLSAVTYEILPNGGMEKQENGLPQGWFMLMRQSNMLSTTSDAHRGEFALEIKTGSKVVPDTVIPFSGADAGGRGGYPCNPGGVYRMKATIRSSNFAKVKLYLNFRDGGGGFLGGQMSSVFSTVDEWREYSWVFHAPNNEVRKFGCGIIILSPDNTVKIDSVSLTYNTEENRERPDIYRKEKEPEISLDLQTAGQELLIDGKAPQAIGEGLHSLLIHADSSKKLIPDSKKYPILHKRWKIISGWHPEAAEPQFDDSGWTAAEFHPDGSVKFPGKGKYTLRQVILWNPTHHGSWKFLLGTTKEYALPQGAIDSLHCALYSPFRHGLKNSQVTFELPSGFRFADMTEKPIGNHRLERPVRVEKTSLKNGERYIITYRDQTAARSNYVLLPLVAPEKMTGTPVIRYYRTGNGNFTELPVEIPVKILPPIADSGKSAFSIQGYEDGQYYPVSEEHAELYYRQAGKIGLNRHFMSPEDDKLYRIFLKEIPHGELVYSIPGSFPMTLKLWGRIPDSVKEMIDWVKNTPEAKVRYMNGKPEASYNRDIENNIHYGAFCPSFVNGKGKAAFQEKIMEIMKKEQAKYPSLKRVFIDWEYSPLRNQQQGIWCFCIHCREAFQKESGLKTLPDDTTIASKYTKEWNKFRSGQDARTVRTISEALKKIGMNVHYYSQEHFDERWKLEGSVPDIFATIPGNSPASHYRQKYIDKQTEILCKGSGVPLMIAQRFARLGPTNAPDGWKTMTICSMDGEFQDMVLWEIQVLRMLASCRGGFDMQSALYYPAGCLYYIAEAMKAVKPYENLIRNGTRADALFSSQDIAYPDVIVIRQKQQILVFLFNETEQTKKVSFELFGIGKGKTMSSDGNSRILTGETISTKIAPMNARILLFK